MVTAVVIPIICLYFYWITRKEMKLNDSKWLASADVQNEAILTGEIKSITQEKQRFYYHRYIFIQELKLQSETKLISAKKIIPIQNNTEIDNFSIGEVIRVYGSWEGNHFHFNEYEKVKNKR
ncbi:hypothetical protein [Bacillus sp. OK048]|uniref:hypothetical protein n=1 Tax=Bacillus sp. OK048 TaxID=1882761 RepID=UPI000880B221|nr:hypothetical protein [Bacillus sp. OK048]SDM04718.1 hypothetical protein SAMN05443253_101602 [Bacillus sp. OK048]